MVLHTLKLPIGQIRWYLKPLYDEPILQQQIIISTFGDHVITKQEVKWVDMPTEYNKD